MESIQSQLDSMRNGDRGDGVRTENFEKLLEAGLHERVAVKLDDIFKTGKLAYRQLDQRAIEALKEFYVEGALEILNQFIDSNLEFVNNKSAFLCSIMKTFRQRIRAIREGVAIPSIQSPTTNKLGPNPETITRILDRTGYEMDITSGQRKYFLPAMEELRHESCEVFCGRLPKEVYEDELILLFEKCGMILDLRLMMDPLSGMNRGYAFITFVDEQAAKKAVESLNEHEIRPKKHLRVNISVPNRRLFVGNIPKLKSRSEIREEFARLTTGLKDVIIYNSPNENKNNRGFCFLEYDTHKNASLAKRRLGTGRVKVWSCDIIVDWADPVEDPGDEVMNHVKVLYVRNIVQEVTEEMLRAEFGFFGAIERVKKIKDFAFVHFENRQNAILAMRSLDGFEIGGSSLQVTLAKPPIDKKKKEEILRARERRMGEVMRNRPLSRLDNSMFSLSQSLRLNHSNLDVSALASTSTQSCNNRFFRLRDENAAERSDFRKYAAFATI